MTPVSKSLRNYLICFLSFISSEMTAVLESVGVNFELPLSSRDTTAARHGEVISYLK